jgi:carboxymethylenebutenolidase
VADRSHVDLGGGMHGELFELAPARTSSGAAVIILHERYGLVQHTLDLADRLARDGYTALAPDLFSRWVGDREALRRGDVRVDLPDDEVAVGIDAGIEHLRRQGQSQIVLMGVCQSGRYPIVVASRRPDIAACVVFYGAAQERDFEVSEIQPRPMAAMLAEVKAPSLFVFGERDHVISLDDVTRVRAALEQGRRSYRMRVFADTPHGWLNDTMPGRFRPREAELAWSLMLTFMDDVLGSRWPPDGRVSWDFTSDTSPAYDFSQNVRLE